MSSFESMVAKVIDMFNIGNFNLWKFKIKMLLASMDFWDIVNGPGKTSYYNVDPKVLKDYQRRFKEAMSIIGLNMVDNQFAYIKSCKGFVEAWKNLCNIHETKNYPISCSFATSSLHARCKRTTICWTT